MEIKIEDCVDQKKDPIRTNIPIPVTESDRVRWYELGQRLKKQDPGAKISVLGRKMIQDVMDSLEKSLGDAPKKNGSGLPKGKSA
jgi:hypothetical protein